MHRREPLLGVLADDRVLRGDAQVGGGSLEIAVERPEDATNCEGERRVRVSIEDRDRSLPGGRSPIQTKLAVGEEARGLDVVRRDLHQPEELRARLFEPAGPGVEKAEVPSRARHSWIDRKRPIVRLARLGEPALPLEDHAQVPPGLREVFVQLDRRTEVPLGEAEVAALHRDDSQVRAGLRKPGVIFEGDVEARFRLVERTVREQLGAAGVVLDGLGGKATAATAGEGSEKREQDDRR